jgi:endonuclease-3
MARGSGGARQPVSIKKPGKLKPQQQLQAANFANDANVAVVRATSTARRNSKKLGQKLSQKAPMVAKSPKTKAAKLGVAGVVLERLKVEYPDAHCELDHRNAFELLCATILSAQCTDVRVNMVTPALFAKYPDAASLAAASLEDVEAIVKSTGFFRAKAKNLVSMAASLMRAHGGEVPRTIPELTALAGVGRKTANVILGNAFNINDGIVVDTHVQRLSRRFGLTREPDPVGIEQALMPLFPREDWALLSHLFIWHGRRVCDARKPRCAGCVVADVCPSVTVAEG